MCVEEKNECLHFEVWPSPHIRIWKQFSMVTKLSSYIIERKNTFNE